MAVFIKDICGLLLDNLKNRQSVLPISKRKVNKWAKGFNLPKGGDTVLYTGQMYQLSPGINSLVKMLELIDNTFIMRLIPIGRYINRFINIAGLINFPSKKEVIKHNLVLRNVTMLLQKAKVAFGYLYEDDLYAGALAHDFGADELVKIHAQKVFHNLKKNNVKRLITVDPHTTNMLRHVFPGIIKDFDIEVRTYIEVLLEKNIEPVNISNEKMVIHDSCVFARHEKLVVQPRILLEKAGVEIINPFESEKYTDCCGGPIESLFPSKALEIGNERMKHLLEKGTNIVVMCPICLANFSRSLPENVIIRDINEILADLYLGN